MPPLLLGLPGDNTYSNYQEANRTFWRQTVIPLSIRTAKALSGWLGAGLVLRPDLDQLDALAPDREALWERLDGASFLTDDEKRAEAGYGPRAHGRVGGAKFNNLHDAAGRFDFAPDGGSDKPSDETPMPLYFDPTSPPISEVAAGKGGIPKALYSWTVRQFVSQYCKGSINSELPKQFENVTIGDVLNMAKGGDAAARTCSKLLSQGRFRK